MSEDYCKKGRVPDKGEDFTAKISRISDSGNGIIEFEDGIVNIGPISHNYAGVVVEATMISGDSAKIQAFKDDESSVGEISKKLRDLRTKKQKQLENIIGSEETVKIRRTPRLNAAFTRIGDLKIKIRGEVDGQRERIKIEEIRNRSLAIAKVVENYPESQHNANHADNNSNQELETDLSYESYPDDEIEVKENKLEEDSEHNNNDADEETAEYNEHVDDNSHDGNPQSTVRTEELKDVSRTEFDNKRENGTITDENKNQNMQNSPQDDDLRALRKVAKKAAVENVTSKNTTNQSTASEYNRSDEVREYVKARADGVCEGCGETAPFISKTGDPYLHAHHIHELSKGGSDTPETVVALCPNCHYRVHHGKNGEKYNQTLLKIVQQKEDSM